MTNVDDINLTSEVFKMSNWFLFKDSDNNVSSGHFVCLFF